MVSVLSDRQDRLVAHLVENELASEAVSDEEYRAELQDLLAKVRGETDAD